MDNILCGTCHVVIRETDYFCFNCGCNLKKKPLSTAITSIFLLILGSILLVPMGLIWGYRYVRENNPKAKRIGFFIIALTVIELIIITRWTIGLVNTINSQVNSQLENIQGF